MMPMPPTDKPMTAAAETSEGTRATGHLGRLVGLGIAIGALGLLWSLLPLAEWIAAFRTWVAAQGIWGHVCFVAVYILATVALAPGSPLTLAAGLAFGFYAFPSVIVGATIGAALAFLVGRYLARSWVARQVAKYPTFRAVDRAIHSEGWKIVALMRLSPLVPFNLQNYFFGVTRVGFWPYVLATFFGIMPGTLLYVWLGTLGAVGATVGSDDASSGEASALKWLALIIGLLATVLVTVLVSRKARRMLEEAGLDEA